ncbi:serine hydrolase [Gillisia sp. M10.2A]|uniref:Serine hydrolase n=1 Tax=Gillisia lutea TaxID=2909668 RepID=A0ABS9EI16_9FLAO|nr:serine hydrolase [Gillisia lutea]MCF4102514.1 serine hydrolase [Gillisia lutea]
MRVYIYTLIYILSSLSLYSQDWAITMDSLLTTVSRDNLFDGQVLIAEGNKILFSKAYGDKSDGTIIQKDTPLAITSVSKAFTAAAILILEDRKKLSLDDELTKYYPDLPYNGVTLRSLLNMTSGLPRFQPTIVKYGDTSQVYTTNKTIELIAEYKPEGIEPGTQFGYNGDNYILLAGIVEKVSGVSYPQFLKEKIFTPLEMDHSYIFQKDITSKDLPALGAGYIFSTAEDLYKFDQGLYRDKLLSPDLIKESYKYTRLKNDSLSNYGYGWRIYDNDSIKEVYVVGDGTDTRSSIQRYLNSRKTLIYIHNNSGSNWKGVYGAVRKIWEGKSFEVPKKRTVYSIDKDLYSRYIGKYLSNQFGLIHITQEDGKLYLRPNPIPGKEELIPSSNTTFYFSDQAMEWEFFLDKEGNVLGLGLNGKPETMGLKQ